MNEEETEEHMRRMLDYIIRQRGKLTKGGEDNASAIKVTKPKAKCKVRPQVGEGTSLR